MILKEGASKGETHLIFPTVWFPKSLYNPEIQEKYHMWCILENVSPFNDGYVGYDTFQGENICACTVNVSSWSVHVTNVDW